MSHLIRIYTVCLLLLNFWQISKPKNGKVHIRNSGVKRLTWTLQYPDTFYMLLWTLAVRISSEMLLYSAWFGVLCPFQHYFKSYRDNGRVLMKGSVQWSVVQSKAKFCLWGIWIRNLVITRQGPSCSKLTTSLVNDSLKFTLSDTQICWNFLLKKCE